MNRTLCLFACMLMLINSGCNQSKETSSEGKKEVSEWSGSQKTAVDKKKEETEIIKDDQPKAVTEKRDIHFNFLAGFWGETKNSNADFGINSDSTIIYIERMDSPSHYTLKGDTLVVMHPNGMTDKALIIKLTEDSLVLQNDYTTLPYVRIN